jgi:DNA-binding response OmpR family regulator
VKVLLVEDGRKIAAAVKRALEAEGFTVHLATDGIEGCLADHRRWFEAPQRCRPDRIPR